MKKITSTLILVLGAAGKFARGTNEILNDNFIRTILFILASWLIGFVLYGPFSNANILYYLYFTIGAILLVFTYKRIVWWVFTLAFIGACAIDNWREERSQA